MKTTITRKELQEIFDISCLTWKPKIEKYAGRNIFADTIDFAEKEIEEMVTASTKEQLPTVKRIFNIVDTFESIQSIEDAITYLGESDETVKDLRLLQSIKISDKIIAQQEAVCFVRALNEKFEFDWNNSNQRKYRVWWYMDKEFRFGFVSWGGSVTHFPASLCFKNEKLAEFAGKNENYKNICKRSMY